MRFDGQALLRSSKVKCLGVMIDEQLSWRKHIDHIKRKCYSAVLTLRRYKDVMPAGMHRRFFLALIIPHIDYCSVLWVDCAKSLRDKVERIQNYGMRLVLLCPRVTPNASLRRQLQWVPLVYDD